MSHRWQFPALIVSGLVVSALRVPPAILGSDGPAIFERQLCMSTWSLMCASRGDHDGDEIGDIIVAAGLGAVIHDGHYGVSIREYLFGSPQDTSYFTAVRTIPDLDDDSRHEIVFGNPAKSIQGREGSGLVLALKSSAPGGPVGPESIIFSVEGGSDAPHLGGCLGVTSSLILASCDKGVVVIDATDGRILARIQVPLTTAEVQSLSGLGDLTGDGVEEFVIAGSGTYVIDGTVRTKDWTLITSPPVEEKIIAVLTSSRGILPGIHGGAGDRELFADLGDPLPDDGKADRLIVSGAPYKSAVIAHLLTRKDDGTFEVQEVATIEGRTPESRLGYDVVGIRDANEDHVADVAIFENDYTGGSDGSGRILIVSGAGLLDGYGDGDSIQEIAGSPEWTLHGGLRDLGDHDMDGFQELLLMGLRQELEDRFSGVYMVIPSGEEPPDCDANGVPDVVDLRGGDFLFDGPAGFPAGRSPTSLAIADLDGDGDQDVVVGGFSKGGFSILRNQGDGRLEAPETIDLGTDVYSIVASDLDRDGDPDIAVGDYGVVDPVQGLMYGTTVSVFLNHGDGTLAAPRAFEVGTGPRQIREDDFDGDGNPDILAVCGTGGGPPLVILRGDGRGGFERFDRRTDYQGDWQALRVADLDGDGDPDLAVAGMDYDVVPLLNDGTGFFAAGEPTGEYAGGDAMTSGDFDGDGDVDIAAASRSAYGISVLLNRGDATFDRAVSVPVGLAAPNAIAAADMDDDGDIDLVTANEDGGAGVWAFHNNGGGSFCEVQRLGTYTRPLALSVADLDGDGRPDLAIGDERSQEVLAFANLTPPPVARDCNKNGKPDSCDISTGRSMDRTGNGIPDECETARFHRGDSNDDGKVELGDAIHVIRYSLLGGAKPGCYDAADANNDDRVDISDAVYVLSFLFRGGPVPPRPGPAPGFCGPDPEGVGAAGDLGCLLYVSC